jgi:hypothetical protein
MQRLNYLLISLALLAVCCGLALRGSQAATASRRAAPLLRAPMQIPIDPDKIFQKGIQVGEIYAPGNDPKATQYVEHWVLYDNYVYPGPAHPELATTIKAAPESDYENEADFFARVKWGPGFRYVRVDCIDTDKLPGR